MEFSKAVLTLDEINFVKRNRLIFDLLDIDKDGKIDIISMLQMIKYLPDKCLLRYEYLLLIDEHKTRSILNASLGQKKPLDFSRFNKLIPQSVLSKALQFAFFGHTIPITSTGSHLIKPPCPFK